MQQIKKLKLTVLILILSWFVYLSLSFTNRSIFAGSFQRTARPQNLENTDSNSSNILNRADLGKNLFFDKRLSANETLSCAVCHDPATAFADSNAVAVGIDGIAGARNVPTILNVNFDKSLFWDGRANSLEEQIKHPLTNPLEMNMPSIEAVVAKVRAIPQYQQQFRQVFKNKIITFEMITSAIAAFEREQVSRNSPFDRFLAGDEKAISPMQKRGWQLFQTKAECIKCHSFNKSAPLFTDFKFHNTGIAAANKNFNELIKSAHELTETSIKNSNNEQTLDMLARTPLISELGRYNVTKHNKDIGAFKTPILRDVELTGPYMHDGSIKTLLDVVRFYNRGGEHNLYLDKDIRPLNLNEQEMSDLVEFVRSLTSDEVLKLAQTSVPQTRERVSLSYQNNNLDKRRAATESKSH